MPFTKLSDNDRRINNTSLMLELAPRQELDKAILQAFGPHKAHEQSRIKYSRTIALEHQPSGQIYTLYRSFGVWRIGGHAGKAAGLLELMELLGAKPLDTIQLQHALTYTPPGAADDDDGIPH